MLLYLAQYKNYKFSFCKLSMVAFKIQHKIRTCNKKDYNSCKRKSMLEFIAETVYI
jgi:hypothetical protein